MNNTTETTADINTLLDKCEDGTAELTPEQVKFQTAFGGKAASIATVLDSFAKYHGKAYLSESSVDALRATLLDLVNGACDGLAQSIRKTKSGKPVINFF